MSVNRGFSLLLLHCGMRYHKNQILKQATNINIWLPNTQQKICRDIFPSYSVQKTNIHSRFFFHRFSWDSQIRVCMFLLLFLLLPFPLSTADALPFTEITFPLREQFKCLTSFPLALKFHAFEEKPSLSLCAHIYFPNKILTQHTWGTFALGQVISFCRIFYREYVSFPFVKYYLLFLWSCTCLSTGKYSFNLFRVLLQQVDSNWESPWYRRQVIWWLIKQIALVLRETGKDKRTLAFIACSPPALSISVCFCSFNCKTRKTNN